MENFKCFMPKVVFGNGKVKEIGGFAREWGNKVFLAIDPYLEKSGYSEEIIALLQESSIEEMEV